MAEGKAMARESSMEEAWTTAYLITIGHHNPKKFPKLKDMYNSKPVDAEEKEKTKQVITELIARRERRNK